jgi:hypothetical protein
MQLVVLTYQRLNLNFSNLADDLLAFAFFRKGHECTIFLHFINSSHFLTALRIVTKLVSIPPGHLSVMGMFAAFAFQQRCLFCFLVATNNIFLPDGDFFKASFLQFLLQFYID